MNARAIDAALQGALENESAPWALLAFVTLSHPSLQEPLRLVSDVVDYIKGGVTFSGMPFSFRPLTDDDRAGQAELLVANVSRQISRAVDGLDVRPEVTLEICSSADFDLGADPRAEIGTAATVYSYAGFEVTEIDVDALEARARVALRDIDSEPFPYIRATEARCPGLFR